jgi:glycopeptide antibiotics resistance protein
MVWLRSVFFKWCKSYFWLSRTRTRTSRIYDSICIVLVVVLVLVLDTKLRSFFTIGRSSGGGLR